MTCFSGAEHYRTLLHTRRDVGGQAGGVAVRTDPCPAPRQSLAAVTWQPCCSRGRGSSGLGSERLGFPAGTPIPAAEQTLGSRQLEEKAWLLPRGEASPGHCGASLGPAGAQNRLPALVDSWASRSWAGERCCLQRAPGSQNHPWGERCLPPLPCPALQPTPAPWEPTWLCPL